MTADSDTPDTSAPAPESGESSKPATAPITIGAQYIKDLSFEAPASPTVFVEMQENSPDIQINVDVRASKYQENTYEVVLYVNAQCVVGEKTAFILELSYGGLFAINAEEDHIRPLLLIECPRMLFPFVRNIIADISRDGGFPPLMLNPLDFVEMYRQGMSKGQSGADSDAGDAAGAAENAPEGSSTH